MTVSFWTLAIAPKALAVGASWASTNSITYEAETYSGPIDTSTNKNLGLADGSKAFTFIDPESVTSATDGKVRNIHVIYFEPGANLSTATIAKYKTYVYQSVTSFANSSAPVDISISPQPSNLASPTLKSCAYESALSWIICPITNVLSDSVSLVFNMISDLLNVRPVQSNQDNALFRAWSYMRSFANIAFIIAFLVIIYSQLTSIGMSNYGIKTMMPRLIIAAILVNLSYTICALMIDISNILGYSIQQVFIDMRNNLVGAEGNSWDLTSIKSITSFVVSGGSAVAAGTFGAISVLSTYGVSGSILLLLPSLAIGFLAVLVALLIMAARQAIVTILVILSPLAFVAYLLPNTEKWFEKWKSNMLTMLILFPAFSIIFGGSQLASAVIIQNADSINTLILGVLVQIAPLFITPLLIKFSGSLLGKIGEFANSFNKDKIASRVRDYAEDRAGNIAARRLAENAPRGFTGAFQRRAQRKDRERRTREGWRKVHEAMADNRFHESHENHLIHEASYEAETNKQRIEHLLERSLKDNIRNTPRLLNLEMEVRMLADEAGVAKIRLDKIQEELRAGTDFHGTGLAFRSSMATRDLALNAIANQTAKRLQQGNLSKSLLENVDRIDGKLLRDYAGDVDPDKGSDSALAYAVNAYGEAANKVIAERTALIKYFKISGEQRQDLTRGVNVTATDDKGHSYVFDATDANTIEAAVEMQMLTGSLGEIEEIISKSGKGIDPATGLMTTGSLYEYRTVIANAIKANGLSAKGSHFAGSFINDVTKGNIFGEAGLNKGVIDSIINGRFKAETLAGNDPGAVKRFLDIAMGGATAAGLTSAKDITNFNFHVNNLKKAAADILDKDKEVGKGASAETLKILEEFSKIP